MEEINHSVCEIIEMPHAIQLDRAALVVVIISLSLGNILIITQL